MHANRVACIVEAGADVEMMELEHWSERSDWSIVRLIFSVFLRIFIAQNMGNFGPREIAIIPLTDACAHVTLSSVGDAMPAITLTTTYIKPSGVTAVYNESLMLTPTYDCGRLQGVIRATWLNSFSQSVEHRRCMHAISSTMDGIVY
jgi:hypothetical protein